MKGLIAVATITLVFTSLTLGSPAPKAVDWSQVQYLISAAGRTVDTDGIRSIIALATRYNSVVGEAIKQKMNAAGDEAEKLLQDANQRISEQRFTPSQGIELHNNIQQILNYASANIREDVVKLNDRTGIDIDLNLDYVSASVRMLARRIIIQLGG